MKQVVLALAIGLCFSMSVFADGVVGIEPSVDSNGNSIPSELNGFEYSLKGDQLYIEEYRGKEKILTINGSYEIDGVTYKTNLEEFEASIHGDVEAVIFGEGIETLSHALFNLCDVQKIFLPITMTKVEDGTLSYLHPKGDNEYIQVYYEGTQDQWSQIFSKYENMTMEKAESAEEYGTAAADWLNSLLGGGYDSSEFEYFFEATPEDLINSKGM